MEGSIGKALRTARLRQKMTVEEAARATKIRPARILDLENDEYEKFPSLAYARSFLLLYAKFLHVDLSSYRPMEVGSPAGVGDYQYLQNEDGVDSLRFMRPPPGNAPAPNLGWLRVFVIFAAFLIVGSLTAWFILNVQRLGPRMTAESDRELLAQPAGAATPPEQPEQGGTPASPRHGTDGTNGTDRTAETDASASPSPATEPQPIPSASPSPATEPQPAQNVSPAPAVEPQLTPQPPLAPLVPPAPLVIPNAAGTAQPKATPADNHPAAPPSPAPSSQPPRALPADGSAPPPLPSEPEVRRAEPVTSGS